MDSKTIYETMLSKCPDYHRNRHYLKRYVRFIFWCIENNKKLPEDTYTERHHILPKSQYFWPEYKSLSINPWNLAVLTPRQHILCHYILAKALGKGMWYAVWLMLNINKDYYELRVSDLPKKRIYDTARKNFSDSMRGKNNPMYGMRGILSPVYGLKRVFSEETRKKISEGNTGKTHTQEWKDYMSDLFSGDKNPMYGISGELSPRYGSTTNHSEETLKKMSEASTLQWADEEKRKARSEEYKNRDDINPPSQKGKRWWNNGSKSTLAFECPEGFVKGRIKKPTT